MKSAASANFWQARRRAASPSINVVPLVDVLLVLLVILLTTASALMHAVRTELPKGRAQPVDAPRESLILTLTQRGELFYRDEVMPDREALRSRLVADKAHTMPVWLAIHPEVPFDRVAELLVLLAALNITDVRFLLEPAQAEGFAR